MHILLREINAPPGSPLTSKASFCPNCLGYRARRPRQQITAKASEDDELPQVGQDWRAFRASLIAKTEGATWDGGVVCDQNLELLRQQNPQLAEEPTWAHPVEQLEAGALLLSTPKATDLVNDARLWQLVIFLTEHGPSGSKGLILNRPAMPLMRDLLGQARLEGDLARLGKAFADNSIYLGSMYPPNKMAQQRLTTIHPHKQLVGRPNGHLERCQELVPGVYLGGELSGAEAVEAGELSASTFRFFAGTMEWGPGQLSLETNSGIWYIAACSRNLIVKQCLQLPVPLWQEILKLLGGDYAWGL